MTDTTEKAGNPSQESKKLENKQVTQDVKEQETTMPDQQVQNDKHKQDKTSEEKEETITISKEEYEKLKKERDEFLENWKRERAESLNFRKFLQDKFDKQMEESAADLLIKLLHVVDEFRRSLENTKGKIDEAYYKGYELVYKQLMDIIEQEGVEVIPITPKETKFDPAYHEALYRVPTAEVEENTVYEVVFTGFKKGSRVLRPAKVAVTTKPPQEEPAQSDSKEDEGENAPVSSSQSEPGSS